MAFNGTAALNKVDDCLCSTTHLVTVSQYIGAHEQKLIDG